MATKKSNGGRGRTSKNRKDEDDSEDGGTRRALWSGSISFGLLQIPVSLHTAEQSNDLRFHQLDRNDLSPIHYHRVNESTGKQVEWKDIVRGYEFKSGEYVVIEDEDLEAANVEATQTIDLLDFVDVKSILPVYFEKPYYVAPGKRADKAYALFRDALARKKVVAVGTVVIRTRQRLCALYPQGDVLILEILRFAHDLRGTEGIDVPKGTAASVTPRELAMAEELIESMRAEWEPEKYRDNYHDDLLALIEKKAKTGKIEPPPKREAPRSNVVDLMSLLRKSVAARRGEADPEEEKKGSSSGRAASKGGTARRTRRKAEAA